MTLFENDDDDTSLFIDPSAENLASTGLALPYAASPSHTRWLFNHGDLNWNPVTEMATGENAAAASLREWEMSVEGESSVVNHPQRDSDNHSVNTECDLLLDMGGGMIVSPPRPGMDYFSPLSGDSIDPFRLWNFADDSEVQELENRKGIMMRPSCIEGNQSLGVWAEALEAENRGLGGMVQQSCWVTHPQPQTSDDYSVNNGAYSVGYELHHRERMMKMTVSELFSHKEFWLNIVVQSMEKGLQVVRTVNILWSSNCTFISFIEVEAGITRALFQQKSVTHSPRSRQCGVHSSPSFLLECLEKDFGYTSNSLQAIIAHFEMESLQPQHPNSLNRQLQDNFCRLAAELEKSDNLKRHTVKILPALHEAKCRMMQLDSPCEPHIPKSSETNEERNNVVVVELNNSIDDAKGGNSSSSHKTHTVSRWEKDHGITCQLLQQLFGKSDDDAAKTLKVSTSTFKRACRDFGITRRSLEEVGTASEENHTTDIRPALEAQYNAAAGRGGMLLQQEDSSSEPHIPEPSATNEVGTASEENHTAHIWPAQYNAAGSGGMLLQQKDSSSEPHIPESSPTNEETNNVVVVELNNTNSIDDAKGGKSNSEKTHTICRWEKDYGITLQALEQLFGKSRNDAAKTFRVSTATFKRACRYFGINRWPNHKVKRSNCSLNQKQHVQAVKKHKGNQSCPALPPEEATTTTLQGNSTMSLMSIKVTYEDNTIRFPLPSSSTLKYLEEQLETRFKICLENFSIMYQDEEADWISLTCDSDLVYGMDVLRSSGKTVVKMKIKPNFG